MAPLRRRWADVQQQARALAARRDAAANAGQRTRLDNELRALLTGFAYELSQVRVLDPACGSGNFLYVALKQLLDLEKAVITEAADLQIPTFFPSVGPEQLRGIEINDYAHELAQVTVWIGYIQWLRDNGFGQPQEPILKPLDTIQHMDAVLALDANGQPVEPHWPEADVIIGNPPFLGGKRLRTELGDQYVNSLFTLYDGRVPRPADFVTYWFERARLLIEQKHVRRAGLLATNSIRQQQNRPVLEKIRQTGDIFMAWSDRPWVLDGAAVHVSMVGFDDGNEKEHVLDGYIVNIINADLTGSVDLTTAKHLVENEGICVRASEKGGPFDISESLARQMLQAPRNINGRPNSDVIRRWSTAMEILRRPQNLWIIDFGPGATQEAAAEYEQPFAYVQQHVYPARLENNEPRTRMYWWQHRRAATDMRAAVASLSRYIVTPVTAKHRVFAWLDRSVLPDITLAVIAREDDYFFGVLHSKLHELWSLRMGTSLEDRPRYTPTTTFETFPFPWPPRREPAGDSRVEAIAAAARALVEKRDRWLNPDGTNAAELKKRTLTNLYNQRPTWLDLAHRQLDHAVLDAYGWPHDLPDDEILARLLALNLERAAQAGPALPAAAAAPTDDGEDEP
jgi:type II restriction/modification system DNA methylase subunit YeeA